MTVHDIAPAPLAVCSLLAVALWVLVVDSPLMPELAMGDSTLSQSRAAALFAAPAILLIALGARD